jgi:hypothetical protein
MRPFPCPPLMDILTAPNPRHTNLLLNSSTFAVGFPYAAFQILYSGGLKSCICVICVTAAIGAANYLKVEQIPLNFYFGG